MKTKTFNVIFPTRKSFKRCTESFSTHFSVKCFTVHLKPLYTRVFEQRLYEGQLRDRLLVPPCTSVKVLLMHGVPILLFWCYCNKCQTPSERRTVDKETFNGTNRICVRKSIKTTKLEQASTIACSLSAMLEQHSSTRSSRLARHVDRVESWRAKWNLGFT